MSITVLSRRVRSRNQAGSAPPGEQDGSSVARLIFAAGLATMEEIMAFPASRKLGLALIGFMAVGIAPASADLIGQTFNANIEITGSDDHGPYTISVLNGPVTGPVVNDKTTVFKQLTLGGFSTASNQITGSVTLNISANAISVNFNGQAQPFELESQFTGIGGNIVSIVESSPGSKQASVKFLVTALPQLR